MVAIFRFQYQPMYTFPLWYICTFSPKYHYLSVVSSVLRIPLLFDLNTFFDHNMGTQPPTINHSFSNNTEINTAWKGSVFGVFLVRIFPHLDWIRTRKTSNTDTFHAVTALCLQRPLWEPTSTIKFTIFVIIDNNESV